MPFEFVPPPKLECLTPATLASVSDDVIESTLINYVIDYKSDSDDELESISVLPVALQAWYIAFVVDAEVLNGGFNQFFFNSSGQLAPGAVEAFNLIGAPAAGRLVETAIELLDQHAPALEAAAEAGTIEAFMETYLEQPFRELDDQYCTGEDDWRNARIRFIRQESAAFRHP